MTKETFQKKWENYWYYYKVHTIVAVFVIIVVAILVNQCASTKRPDITVALVSKSTPLTDNQVTQVQNVFSKYTSDVNGDGQKMASCENYYMGSKQDPQMTVALNQKLAAEASSGDVMIYICDDDYYKEFTKGSSGLFADLGMCNAKDKGKDSVKLSQLPDFSISGLPSSFGDLSISIRAFDKKKSASKEYKNAVSILRQILKSQQ